MSIKYNNKVIAGKYKEQVIPFANTVDAGIAKIATQEEINEGVSNETIVTPVYLAQKQDKLTAGNGIHIDATNTISSKLSPDKTTIVENENNTLTTVARQTVNENILFDWEGTEAEYHQAIMNGEIDPSWYCYITDDELAVSYNDVLSRTLVNIAPQGAEKLNVSKAYLTNDIYTDEVGYNQLLELKNNAYKNDVDYITANGVKKEIPYTLTRTGSKIVSAEYREFLTTFYEENGYTNYFTIDEENKNYTLPMGEIYGKLVDKDLSTLSETAKEVIKDLTGVSFGLFDTKISDHVLSYEESLGWALQGTYVYRDVVTGERYGYPDFYNKCLEEYTDSTSTETVNGVTVKVNSNGHKYYSISDKTAIDEFYTTYGIADFYGIDEENKRIFLPRNKYFQQLTDDTTKVNEIIEAGLPNITGTINNAGNTNGTTLTGTGSFTISGLNNGGYYGGGGRSNEQGKITFNASKSSSIYGNSDTVQPQSSLKLLYYCVGNTKADTSWVNIVAQVDEGVKEIYDQKTEVLQEIEDLRQDSITEIDTLRQNSVTEVDTLRATSVNEISTLNTSSLEQIGTLRSDSIQEVLSTKEDYLQELEDKRVSSNESLVETKNNGLQELVKTSENLIEQSRLWAIGTEEENAEGSAKYWAKVAELSSSNAIFDTKVSDHILNDAEAYGWTLCGTKAYKEAVVGEHLGYPTFYETCLNEYEQAEVIERKVDNTISFNTYRHKNGHEYYLEQDKQYVDQIINIHTHNMYGINLEEQSIIIPHINRTLIESKQPSNTDSSWYNLYSDGWCEQGGFFASSVNNNNCTVTFLKPFKDNNYDIQTTSVSAEGYAFITNKTNTSALIGVNGGNKARNWQASGYANLPDTKLTYTYMCTGNSQADTSWINVVEQVAEGAKEIYDTKEGVLQEVDTLRQDSLQEMEDKRLASNESIIDTKEDSIQELVETSQDLINESRKWAVGTENENAEGSAKYWAGVAELSSSNAMFDIKVSDHILKDSEAYGWGLQGTYVYREAVLNDHLGYPTFYDKCIEEYKNSFMAIPNVNTVGTLTNDKGILSGFSVDNYARISNKVNLGNNFEIVFKITTGEDVTTSQRIFDGLTEQYLAFFIAGNTNCFNYAFGDGTQWLQTSEEMLGKNQINPNTSYKIKITFDGTVYISYISTEDGLWVEDWRWESANIIPEYNFIIGISRDLKTSCLCSIDFNESYIKINDQLWWEGGLVYQNENGHQYFNISDKTAIDEIYNIYGIAWFYGIDEENKRILLPRNDWFAIQGVAPVVGNGLVFGLTDGTNYGSYAANANGNLTFHTDLYGKTVGSSKSGNGSSKYVGMGFTTDPTKSGIEAHLQSDDTKYLYICTANTKADTSWMTLTEQVEAGIKEVEDKRAESIQDIDTLRQDSIEEINTLRSDSIQEVLETKENFLEELEDKKISCVNLIEETKDNGIQELVATSEDLINESRKWAIGTENENAEGSAKFWAETAQLASSNALFDTKISDHILEGPELYGWALQGTWIYKEAVLGEHLGYPTFYEKCLEEKENATSTNITLGSNTVAIYINNNGHQFYDITDKEAVDLFYSTYGVADYYGIDTENERIFLPRNIKNKRYLVESKKATSSDNTWYNLYSDGWLEQGGIVASGSNSNTVTLPKSFKDTSYSVQLTNSKTATIANYAPVSNITANNTFVVYSNGDGCKGCNKYWLASGYTDSIDIKDKFIYYCVGNTKADTSWINLVEQVQEGVKEIYDEKVKSLEEIDTLRQDSVNEIDVLKANSVQEIVDTKNNSLKEVDDTTLRGLQSLAGASNALTHNQVTNCLLEIPQRIKLELTDGVLTLKAGSTFILPNGVDNFEHITIESDISRDVFGTTTSSNMFIQIIMSSDLKTANLSFFRPEQVVCSETQPETNSTSLWYDLANNKIYTVSSSVIDDNIRSLPIAIANIENGVVKEISHIFNGFGYIGSTVWVDKGVKGLVPNGRNEDGTLNNIEFETQSVLTKTITNTDDIDCTIAIDSNRLYLYAKRDDRYYDGEQNYIIHSDIKMSFAYVGEYHSNNCVISDFKPKSTFRAIDYNDITNILSSGGGSTVSITEEYIGENEGYRLYSNGLFEQWGYIEKLTSSSSDKNITIYKPIDLYKEFNMFYIVEDVFTPAYYYTLYDTTKYPAAHYYNQVMPGMLGITSSYGAYANVYWSLISSTSITGFKAIHPTKDATLVGGFLTGWSDSKEAYFKGIHWHMRGYVV